jgi:hypothetical protein
MREDIHITIQPLFDISDAVRIQQQQLSRWAAVLTAEAFAKLYRLVTTSNDKATSGHDIVRGDRITEILHNQVMR